VASALQAARMALSRLTLERVWATVATGALLVLLAWLYTSAPRQHGLLYPQGEQYPPEKLHPHGVWGDRIAYGEARETAALLEVDVAGANVLPGRETAAAPVRVTPATTRQVPRRAAETTAGTTHSPASPATTTQAVGTRRPAPYAAAALTTHARQAAMERHPPKCAEGKLEYQEPAVLACAGGTVVAEILFASYGEPTGDVSACDAGMAVKAGCHASNSRAVVEKACLGQAVCTVASSVQTFNIDPCPGNAKWLKVRYVCGSYSPPTSPPTHPPEVRQRLEAEANGKTELIKKAISTGHVIWVFYQGKPENLGKPHNAMVRLNMETWSRALPKWPVVVVNDSNIHEYIPDLPTEYYRMPYTQVRQHI